MTDRLPRSILVIRLSAIGDVVMASPLIAALRHQYPRARIAWLVQPEAAGVLEANPDLDRVIVWPRGSGTGCCEAAAGSGSRASSGGSCASCGASGLTSPSISRG